MKGVDSKTVEQLLKKRDMSQTKLAERMGRSKATISGWIRRGDIPDAAIPLLCEVLECNPKDLQESEKAQEGTAVHIIEELGEIKGLMKKFEMSMFNVHNEVQQLNEIISPDFLTNKDKAVLILKQMMGDTGRVDEQDYISKCNDVGVDNHSRKYAIEKTDCNTQTIGYGNNSKRVIFKSVKGV